MIIVVMGVAGSGKTTIGRKLAASVGWPFYDADDFHPKENIIKMADGKALQDDDRWPWLVNLNKEILVWESEGNAVLACSALKESYRKMLAEAATEIEWVYLHGSRELIEQRINSRKGHYMKSYMLESQLEALEEPDYALQLNISKSPEELISTIKSSFGL